jgi:hypothetical protein
MAQSASPTHGSIVVHQGKQLRLVRRATPTEFESASKRFQPKPGDQVWYYETIIEILADETGFCLVREGQIVSRFIVSAS